MKEYPYWEVYIKRLTESGLDVKAAREVVDLIVQTAIDKKSLDEAFKDSRHSLEELMTRYRDDTSKELSAVSENLDHKLDARINAANNKMILWVIGSLLTVSGLTLAAARILLV
ncbi:hypothetical protein O4H49_20000 [Kiloniella laminariae]|uniref:DUF1640 domain-containing protein n=1 Tax=Kiloniella laminariae TaxID=454162 RepID=A0ABT4LPM4_9PROT|nr:hypothetical protein [Kiloniella laminariae]MCZ4283078.1 hypothetical protein [Kiloniella laminariae]